MCHLVQMRTMRLQQINTCVLQASKMYDISAKRLSLCSTQCIKEPICYYLTWINATAKCTLYTSGSTIYGVSNIPIYVIQNKNVQVIIIK